MAFWLTSSRQAQNMKNHAHNESDPDISRSGRMWAVGWHRSQEKNMEVVFYAPEKTDDEERKIDVERVLRGMSTVATRYRERMHTLLPGAALRAAEIAET